MDVVRTVLLVVGIGGLALMVAHTGMTVARAVEELKSSVPAMVSNEIGEHDREVTPRLDAIEERLRKFERELRYLKAENHEGR